MGIPKGDILDREYLRLLAAFGIDVGEALRAAGVAEDAFLRAFDIWTGQSPSKYRKA